MLENYANNRDSNTRRRKKKSDNNTLTLTKMTMTTGNMLKKTRNREMQFPGLMGKCTEIYSVENVIQHWTTTI